MSPICWIMTEQEKNDIYDWLTEQDLPVDKDGNFINPWEGHGWMPEDFAELLYDYENR